MRFYLHTHSVIYNNKSSSDGSQLIPRTKSVDISQEKDGLRQNQRPSKSFATQDRESLIEMVMEHNISIYRASEMLKINNATAKVIVKRFRDNGTIFTKKRVGLKKKLPNIEDMGKAFNERNPSNEP